MEQKTSISTDAPNTGYVKPVISDYGDLKDLTQGVETRVTVTDVPKHTAGPVVYC